MSPYNVVFMYAVSAGAKQSGIEIWASFESEEVFNRFYTPEEVQNRLVVVLKGISEDACRRETRKNNPVDLVRLALEKSKAGGVGPGLDLDLFQMNVGNISALEAVF